jgi:hypothetical protein
VTLRLMVFRNPRAPRTVKETSSDNTREVEAMSAKKPGRQRICAEDWVAFLRRSVAMQESMDDPPLPPRDLSSWWLTPRRRPKTLAKGHYPNSGALIRVPQKNERGDHNG